jgi:crotonobetainyl-CoA:carnitine CoA-transferase CaiB-like acyl-CoA transferase
MAPHGVYPCAGDDRWIAIACEDDAQWRHLCSVIRRPELATDVRFADVVSRMHHRTAIDDIVSAWTRNQDAHEAAQLFQAVGVPAGAVQLVSELLTDPQLTARGYITIVRHPEAGDTPYARPAFTLSQTPLQTERHAPLYGQDIDYVLRELLMFSAAEVEELEAALVTARRPL